MSVQRTRLGRFGIAAFAVSFALVGAGAGSAGAAQRNGTSPGQVGGPPPQSMDPSVTPSQPGLIKPGSMPPDLGMPPSVVAAAARAQANARQKRLIDDTNKLLALATQLQADVARTDKNMLSVDVIRRAEEIEKLAHSVKERERGQ